MYKIFLIIFVFQYIKADNDESNEKYIDLLPEEDKQEFLNRIARRILEEVNSSDIPNASHAEVNKEQLEAQNDYVKQIIKEESIILQNERRDNLLINDQEINNKVDKNNDNQPHIDLTLRNQSRKKRNDSELNELLDATSELRVIPVKNDQVNVKSNANSAIKSELNEDIQANNGKNITTEYKDVKNDSITINETKSIGNISVVRRAYDDELLSRTTISNYDPESEPDSEENISSTEDETIVSSSTISPHHIDNANTTDSDDGIIWISTKKIYDSESNEDIKPESAEKISSSILTTLPDVEQVTTSSITNSTLEPKESTEEITTLKINEDITNINQSSNINTRQVILNNHLYLRSGELENGSNITQVTNNELSDLKTIKNDTDSVKKIVNKTSSETNLNSNDAKSNTSDTRSRYLVNNKKENNNDVKVKDSQISLKESHASKEPEIDMKHNLKSNAKEYEVFEVAADKPPFLMKPNVEIQDTTHYVPVYNYAPNYAYYSPRSRFEPNEESKYEDEKENYEIYSNSDETIDDVNKKSQLDSPIIRSIFSGYDNREKDFYRNQPGRYIMKKQNYNLFDLKRPTQVNNLQNIYYNPNDYLDMDYYFGRTDGSPLRKGNVGLDDVEARFPDSNEKDHPYHSIHRSDTIKDHIRAVRNLLYLNHIFEPIIEIKKNKSRKFYDKHIQSQNVDITHNKRDELRNKNEDNIAIDYYFGVMSNDKAVQAVTMSKPNNNKLLRKPGKNKGLKTNANYDKLNIISNTNSIDNKVNNKLDEDIDPMLEVLRDFIRFDNIAMLRYNWLESTVDILAAVKKLLQLMKQLQFGEYINPKDLELIKYILYLYKSSLNTLKEEQHYIIKKDLNDEKEIIKRNKSILPKNKRNHKIRQPLKLWRDMFSFIRSRDVKQERVKLLYDFEDFLQNILFRLRDFHDAIKHIAMITKYNNQKWYEDFKNIYLHNLSNAKMLTLLLHLSVTKLLNSIEESATDGAENSFMNYIIYNKQYVKRSKEEFLFVLNILHEMRKLNIN